MAWNEGKRWVENGTPDRGGRFFGELKGLPLKKSPTSESWIGNGLLGGAVVEVEVLPHDNGKKVTIDVPMYGLRCVDIIQKVGAQWVGDHVFVKTAADRTKWLNLKTNRTLVGESSEEEW